MRLMELVSLPVLRVRLRPVLGTPASGSLDSCRRRLHIWVFYLQCRDLDGSGGLNFEEFVSEPLFLNLTKRDFGAKQPPRMPLQCRICLCLICLAGASMLDRELPVETEAIGAAASLLFRGSEAELKTPPEVSGIAQATRSWKLFGLTQKQALERATCSQKQQFFPICIEEIPAYIWGTQWCVLPDMILCW